MARISVLCYITILVLLHTFANGSEASEHVEIYELKKGNMSMKLTNWGATLMSLILPDKNGKLDDVVLGYDTIDEYKHDKTYFGAVVGRVANRIGGAQFTLKGKHYKLDPNEGSNMLHGGPRGFSDVVWNVTKHQKDGDQPHIKFEYDSKDGDEGFPGDLHASVVYMLSRNDKLKIIMKAKAKDKETPVNLAQHAYWNLGGHKSGDILSQEIQIFASHFTPVDDELIPTGQIASVEGTPYDFLKPRPIKSKLNELPKDYDINYALDVKGNNSMKTAVILHDTKSGRRMELLTNQPGLQFYTGGQLKGNKGKDGALYKAHAALCLETQKYPDAVNHPNFPSTILEPKKTYKHYMQFKFSAK